MICQDPAFVWVDKTLEKAVEHATRLYLESYAETSIEVSKEYGVHGHLPYLTPEGLNSYLSEALELREDSTQIERTQLSVLVARKVLSLVQARLEIDRALEEFLKGKGVISETSLYVNDPTVERALQDYSTHFSEVMLVAVPGHYDASPIPGDHRKDLLVSSMRWGHVHLCRPALVDVGELGINFLAADSVGPMTIKPTVSYQPFYGLH